MWKNRTTLYCRLKKPLIKEQQGCCLALIFPVGKNSEINAPCIDWASQQMRSYWQTFFQNNHFFP